MIYRSGRSNSDLTSEEYYTLAGADEAFTYPTIEIHIGVAGDLDVTRIDGERVTLTGLTEGRYAIAAINFWAAGSTASDVTVFF